MEVLRYRFTTQPLCAGIGVPTTPLTGELTSVRLGGEPLARFEERLLMTIRKTYPVSVHHYLILEPLEETVL